MRILKPALTRIINQYTDDIEINKDILREIFQQTIKKYIESCVKSINTPT